MPKQRKQQGDRVIPLSHQDYAALERAMQWPEDLARYDSITKPTSLGDLFGGIQKEVKDA